MDYNYVTALREKINALKPALDIPTSHGNKRPIFVHRDLLTCTHVYIRTDAVKKPLQSPYEGPYPVIKRDEKTYLLQLPNLQANISIDRLKPAFTVHCDDSESTRGESTCDAPSNIPTTGVASAPTPPPAVHSNAPIPTVAGAPSNKPATASPGMTTRTGRKIRLPVRFA